MAEPPERDPFPESRLDSDAGATFVLESKGEESESEQNYKAMI